MPLDISSKLYTLDGHETEILKRAEDDPNILLEYFTKKNDAKKGFALDYNFSEKGKWQKAVCMADQTFIVCIAGIGSGKTLGIGMGAIYHAIMTDGFKFMNIGQEGYQAELMYSLIVDYLKDTPAWNLVVGFPKRPHPQITFEFFVNGHRRRSVMEFMSLGDKKDATNIFSWRGDWINIEEAGLIDNLAEVVGNLASRLTGSSPSDRPYMARMSLISNAWENPELWQFQDIAAADSDGLVINCDTSDNKNVTEKQVKNFFKKIPDSDKERFTTGKRPEARGTYFPAVIVEPCMDRVSSTKLLEAFKAKQEGYVMSFSDILGYWNIEFPRQDGRVYWQVGDPGTGQLQPEMLPYG